MLLQPLLSGKSYFFRHQVIRAFFPMTEVLIFTSCQSATGHCLAALEALSDNVKGNTANIVGAATRGNN